METQFDYLFDLSTFDDDQLAALDAMRVRYHEKTEDQKRLEFARWLVGHGVLNEWGVTASTEVAETAPHASQTIL